MVESLDARAKCVFDQVIDRNDAERTLQIERACAGAPELRARVEALLAAAEKDDAFLGEPTLNLAPAPATAEQPGARIGPYTLLELIGEGGFGSVFRAEQSAPVRRQVALKIIKAGMDTRQVIARFEAERQALALMEHPNIARVLEAGATESGRPYFVMELVRGERMTTYCDRECLSVTQRLELFRDVCAAVQHAHQKGIIHRDLKPSNILVTRADGAPRPKVIEFGIAKATAARLSDETLTGLHQLIGTPEYMSPEQAAGAAADIDTRSDIYALGVLLYELLTGTTPFDRRRLADSGFDSMRRILRDEEPPRPSARLSDSSGWNSVKVGSQEGSSADPTPPVSAPSHVPTFSRSHASPDSSLATIAHARRSDPATLTRTLRRDLDWIVLKCLEKDRARRYETAGALADDIGRYLGDEPVLATPPSARDWLRKFVRRHRVGVLAGAAVVLALAAGFGAALYGLDVARHERDSARQARDDEKQHRLAAERVSEFLSNMLKRAGPEKAEGRDVALLRSFLDDAVGKIERGELADAPEAEADLRMTISKVYREIADTQSADRLLGPVQDLLDGPLRGNDRLLEKYLDVRSLLLDSQARYDESIALAGEAIEMRRRMPGQNDKNVAALLSRIGASLHSQGKFQEALARFREALVEAQASGDDATIGCVYSNLADTLGELGQFQDALESTERALEINRRVYTTDSPFLADSINNVAATILRTSPNSERALTLLQEAVDMKKRLFRDGHPHLGISISNLGYVLEQRGRLDEAEQNYVEARDMLRKFGPQQEAAVAMPLLNLARLSLTRKDPALAETYSREALEICERQFPTGHPHTTFALMNIGASLRDRGRHEESIEPFEQAAKIQRRILGPNHPFLAKSLSGKGNALMELGRFDEALPALQEALAIARSTQQSDPAGYASSLAKLATALIRTNDLVAAREAASFARESLEIRRRVLASDDWLLANTGSVLGGALVTCAELDLLATTDDRLITLREAEPLLANGFVQLDAARDRIPDANRARVLADAAERLARLYGLWNTLDSSAGKSPLANEWREKLKTIVQTGL